MVRERRTVATLVYKHDGLAVVVEAQQVLSKIEPRAGKPTGAGHAVEMLDDHVVTSARHDTAKIPDGRPEWLRLIDRPTVQRRVIGHRRVTTVGHETHERGQVRFGDLVGGGLPEGGGHRMRVGFVQSHESKFLNLF